MGKGSMPNFMMLFLQENVTFIECGTAIHVQDGVTSRVIDLLTSPRSMKP